MDIVILAAGTSSRMGKTNKMLIPWNGKPLAVRTCLNALEYLEQCPEKSKLTVVTGYRHRTLTKALRPCIEFVEKTSAPVTMTIIRNQNYRQGQFTSALKGIAEVTPGSRFFITLADMPYLVSEHYKALIPHLQNHDCVRPTVHGQPGHPVLFAPHMKQTIPQHINCTGISQILKQSDTHYLESVDFAFVKDIDTPEDLPADTK